MKKLLFLVGLFIFAVPATAQSSVQEVDFKNFTYNLSCGSADKSSFLTVKNGLFDGLKNSFEVGEVEVHLKIYEIKFQDLDGDNKDEAVVLYACGSGASYVYFRGLIFKMKNQKPTLLTEIEGGNKGDGGFHKIHFSGSQLIVERYQLPPAGSACCPKFIETAKYKLIDDKLVQIGKNRLRKISASN